MWERISFVQFSWRHSLVVLIFLSRLINVPVPIQVNMSSRFQITGGLL